MASYEFVNYRLRTAKGTERKMLCEIMRRLSVFGPVEQYSYVGFGSIYFTDFLLFHKVLGFQEMHSIEADAKPSEDPLIQNRFEFNKPYSCVKIHYGRASERLPDIDWKEKKAAVWLDYDKSLRNEHIQDMRIVLQSAEPGSLLLISVNVEADKMPGSNTPDPKEERDFRQKQLRKRLNASYLPPGTESTNLSTPNLIRLYHTILNGVVTDALSKRGGAGKPERAITAKQILNIQYSDGASMLTFGWLLINAPQTAGYANAHFEEISFFRSGPEPFKILVPNLTLKEISWLDSVLHTHVNADGTIAPEKLRIDPSLPPEAVLEYVPIYRYFPTFAEAIL